MNPVTFTLAVPVIVTILAAPIIGRVAYLSGIGSRRRAVSSTRYSLFFTGYAMLAAAAAYTVLDAWAGHVQCGTTYVFLLASDMLILFRKGSEPRCEPPTEAKIGPLTKFKRRSQ